MSLTIADIPGGIQGVAWSMEYRGDLNQVLPHHSENGSCYTSCTYSLPLAIPTFPATLGMATRPQYVKIKSGVGSATYTINFTRTPRPGYNTGGTSFANATVLPTAVSTIKATLHPSESGSPPNSPPGGQYFRVTIPQGGMISLNGYAHRWAGFNSAMVADLYNASQVNLTTLVFATASAPTADPFVSSVYTNTGPAADFYLKIFSPQYLLHDTVMQVEVTPSRTLTLFLDSNGDFNIDDPIGTSERATYVPGAFPDGVSVPLVTSSATPLQIVEVIAAYVDPQGKIVTPPPISGSALFQLNYTSGFTGVAMNRLHPVAWARSETDADFELQSTVAQFSTDNNRTARVPLKCWDYGGFTLVTVTHGTAPNQFFADMRVPKDGDGNLIPDAGWLAAGYGPDVPVADTGLSAADDNDLNPTVYGPPLGGQFGDGLSRYEEYRGFLVSQIHRRTNPNVKDLFGSSSVTWVPQQYVLPPVSIGLEFAFPNLPAVGVLLHRVIGKDESPNPEYDFYTLVLNGNIGNGGYGGEIPHVDQKAVRVLAGSADPGSGPRYGNAFGTCPNGNTAPNTTDRLEVNTVLHESKGVMEDVDAEAVVNEIKRTVGHEIGHAIDIAHRPETPEDVCLLGRTVGSDVSIMSIDWLGGADMLAPGSQYNSYDVPQIRLKLP